jgi:hypothetical protein
LDDALVTSATTDRPPGLVPVIWRAGQETLAVAVGTSGGVFVAMGFVSNAAETALIGVADANQPAAVLALK